MPTDIKFGVHPDSGEIAHQTQQGSPQIRFIYLIQTHTRKMSRDALSEALQPKVSASQCVSLWNCQLYSIPGEACGQMWPTLSPSCCELERAKKAGFYEGTFSGIPSYIFLQEVFNSAGFHLLPTKGGQLVYVGGGHHRTLTMLFLHSCIPTPLDRM